MVDCTDDYASVLNQNNNSYASKINAGITPQGLIRTNASVKRGNVSPYDRPE